MLNRLILSESLRSIGLSFSTTLCNHHSYTTCNNKDADIEEEPKEPQGIVTEIAAIQMSQGYVIDIMTYNSYSLQYYSF